MVISQGRRAATGSRSASGSSTAPDHDQPQAPEHDPLVAPALADDASWQAGQCKDHQASGVDQADHLWPVAEPGQEQVEQHRIDPAVDGEAEQRYHQVVAPQIWPEAGAGHPQSDGRLTNPVLLVCSDVGRSYQRFPRQYLLHTILARPFIVYARRSRAHDSFAWSKPRAVSELAEIYPRHIFAECMSTGVAADACRTTMARPIIASRMTSMVRKVHLRLWNPFQRSHGLYFYRLCCRAARSLQHQAP